jgi:anti-sigma factor RsiW
MQHPDEGTIHAWIDGELAVDEAAALEKHLQGCAECSALAAEARGLAAASSRIVSALDIVPGDVIPKNAPARRPWYASTQLRAAAAVVVVAGASLLVIRDRGVTRMEHAVMSSAPSAVRATAPEPVVDSAKAQVAAAPTVVAAPTSVVPKQSGKKKGEAVISDLRTETANGAAKSPPPPTAIADAPASVSMQQDAMKASKAEARSDSLMRRRLNSSTLDQVVVTGVATATVGPAELKKIRTDSVSKATVYEVSPGVEVTLSDMGPRPVFSLRSNPTAQSKEREATAPQAPVPPPVEAGMSGKVAGAAPAQINSISWIDARGHQMVLTGPLSKQQLEMVRRRLPTDRR